MTDTMRSLATLATLLADNSTKDISAQDLRDAVLATIQPGHGEISLDASDVTAIGVQGTFYVVEGTYSLTSPATNWDMNTNGQLRYIGVEDRVVHITGSFSNAAANQATVELHVAKDGTPITPSKIQRKMSGSGDIGTGAIHAFTTVSTNNYLTVEVANTTGTDDLTFHTLNLFAMDMAK
jgi:hypothetical protein